MKKLTSPVVLKTGNSSQIEISRLERQLAGTSQPKEKQELEAKIRNFRYGLDGEKTVLFQLKNSYMPMYILHDLHLQFEDCKAQIDFLVVTRKLVLVLECKRLYGNMYINENGNFIRVINPALSQMEGMESPYTQNERHLKLIYSMCRAEQKNFIQRLGFARAFPKIYRSVIVLANPKTIINMDKAPENIRSVVKRADELNSYIETLQKNSHVPEMSDEEMKEIAEFFLSRDMEKSHNSTPESSPSRTVKPSQAKTESASQTKQTKQSGQPAIRQQPEKSSPKKSENFGNFRKQENPQKSGDIENSPLFEELRAYRMQVAVQSKMKAYEVCNNAQLVRMIQEHPRTMTELKKLDVFYSEEACRKFGAGFLEILAKSAPAKKSEKSEKSGKSPESQESVKSVKSIEDSKVYSALRSYRYNQSQKEKIKPYLICNNEQLINLIRSNPRTLAELRKLDGFQSEEKCRKYGTEILKILAEHQPKPVKQSAKPATESRKTQTPPKSQESVKSVKSAKSIEDSKVYSALRSYRYNQSQKENIKPYLICNNDQLVKLIQANPRTLAELRKLDGFQSAEKCKKYGSAILKILKDFA